jgi:hypothetical protein
MDPIALKVTKHSMFGAIAIVLVILIASVLREAYLTIFDLENGHRTWRRTYPLVYNPLKNIRINMFREDFIRGDVLGALRTERFRRLEGSIEEAMGEPRVDTCNKLVQSSTESIRRRAGPSGPIAALVGFLFNGVPSMESQVLALRDAVCSRDTLRPQQRQ